jgi:hypothetical protein
MMNLIIKNTKIKVKNTEWYNVKSFCAILDRWGFIKYNAKNGKVSYQGKGTTMVRHQNEISYLLNNHDTIRRYLKNHGIIKSIEKINLDNLYKNVWAIVDIEKKIQDLYAKQNR